MACLDLDEQPEVAANPTTLACLDLDEQPEVEHNFDVRDRLALALDGSFTSRKLFGPWPKRPWPRPSW
jgi:hypothetical protein